MSDSLSFVEPPEAVVSGASIPRENQQGGLDEYRVETTMAALRRRGELFASLSESDLRERAVARLERLGVR